MSKRTFRSAARSDPPSWLVNLVWIAAFLVVWNLIALLFQVTGQANTKFPFLHNILRWAFSPEYDGAGIWLATSITLSVFAKGLIIGFLIGVLFAILMSACLPIEKVGYPLLLLSQMIPMLGLAPIIVSMVGNFSTAKLVMSAYMTFFPVGGKHVCRTAGSRQLPEGTADYVLGKPGSHLSKADDSSLPAVHLYRPEAGCTGRLCGGHLHRSAVSPKRRHRRGDSQFPVRQRLGALLGIYLYGCADRSAAVLCRLLLRETCDPLEKQRLKEMSKWTIPIAIAASCLSF